MTASARKIEQSFADLPLEDLLALYGRLLETIYTRENAEGLDPDFRAEIQRRIDEIDAGRAQRVDAFAALKQM